MAPPKDLKEEIKKLMEIKGGTRGGVFKTDALYVLSKEGESGLKKVEELAKELDCPLNYNQFKTMEWYPVGLRAISLILIQKVFGWGDAEISKMGNESPKHSFISKMLMKYFLSAERSFIESPKYWVKHYNIGRLESVEFNEKEKYTILRLYEFEVHPILCTYFFENGYFLRIAQYGIKSDKIFSKETKCIFRGDPYHECLIRWE
jgi:hypothetical protein